MTLPNTTLEKFQAARTRAELAALLDIKHSSLTYLLYVKKDAERYKTFTVPKKNGGLRSISAPIDELKSLQRRVAAALTECIADKERLTGVKNSASHGFTPGKSILTNASVHRNKRYVLNLDLQNFFPTISGKRIRGLLINDRTLKLHPDIATTLAHIACFNGSLPQGSPCSPVFSNLIAGILDLHLVRLAKANGCRYTRYADDITFSTNEKEFPKTIAFADSLNENLWSLGAGLLKPINKSGFQVNDGKTRMQYQTSRQVVTGLVVNKKVNVPAEYRRLARAYVFSLVNKGSFVVKKRLKNDLGLVVEKVEVGTIPQLHGMLGFIHSVDNVFRADLKKNPYNYPGHNSEKGNATGNLAIFRRFLLYTRFYANDMPLLIGEGKTDGVYLSCAVHQSGKMFPRLIQKDKDGKDVLAFRLLKYARRHRKKKNIYLPNFSTVSILGGGSGGGGNLANLVEAYAKEHHLFRGPRGDNPVIIIVDDDSGAKPVKSLIKKLFKIEVDPIQPYTHVFANLYVVMVSDPSRKETSIEDLFSVLDLAKGLNGKPFDFSKDADPKTTVGKDRFAHEFVAKSTNSIDWTGFHPLLARICSAMNDFDGLKASGKI